MTEIGPALGAGPGADGAEPTARTRREIFVRRSRDSGAPASPSVASTASPLAQSLAAEDALALRTGDPWSILGANEEEGRSLSPKGTRRGDSKMGTAPDSARASVAPAPLELRAGRATTSEARVRPTPLPMGRVNERTLLPPLPMTHTPPQGLWPLYRPEDAGVAGEAAYAAGIEAHKPRCFTPRGVPEPPVAAAKTPRFEKHAAQWDLWESRWERQERELRGVAGSSRGSAQLVMNSMEEYKDRIVFQDLLEESRPQRLSDNLKFATDCRSAGQYFIPLGGVASRPFDPMAHWLPIKVRTEGGRIVSAAKYQRASIPPSPKRAIVRAESAGRRDDHGSRAVYSPEPMRASEMDRWKERPDKEYEPLMQGTPAYVKAKLGDGRKHTVVDGKIRLLKQGANPDQGKKPEQILYEKDGIVSGFARERELRQAELAARSASTRDESYASQLTPPPNPPPLVLSARRLSFVSVPGVGREQVLLVTNSSATTLLVSAHHMTAAPLPAPEAHPHGLTHEEEVAAEALRGATDASVSAPAPRQSLAPPASGRPSAPQFVLAIPELYVLPGQTAGFRVVFAAELAGSYTHSLQLRTTPAAGLAPVAVELSAKCLAAAPDTKAMRDLETKLARCETLGFVRELVLRAMVAPAAEQGARRVRVAEGLAEPPEPNAGEAALGGTAEEEAKPAKGKKPTRLGKKEHQEAEAAAAARAAADAAAKAEAATRPPPGVDAVWWARERDWAEWNPELPLSPPLWSALERVARAAGVVGWTGSLEQVEDAAAAGPNARGLLEELDAILSDASSRERGPEPRGRETLVRAAVGLALSDLVDASLAAETLRATQLAPFAAAPHGVGLTYGGVRFVWSWEELCYLHAPETEGAPRKRLACAAPPPPPPELTPSELAAIAKAKKKVATAAPRGGGKNASEPLAPPELVPMPFTTAAAGARPADAGPPFRALLLKLADSIADLCAETA